MRGLQAVGWYFHTPEVTMYKITYIENIYFAKKSLPTTDKLKKKSK